VTGNEKPRLAPRVLRNTLRATRAVRGLPCLACLFGLAGRGGRVVIEIGALGRGFFVGGGLLRRQ